MDLGCKALFRRHFATPRKRGGGLRVARRWPLLVVSHPVAEDGAIRHGVYLLGRGANLSKLVCVVWAWSIEPLSPSFLADSERAASAFLSSFL